jgi:hypothetical protein
LGNPLGKFLILRQVASIVVSIETMAVGDNAIKRCVCIIWELASYSSKRCFMPYGRGVERTDWLMSERMSRVHVRCDLGHSDAMRAVPTYPFGRVSSCDILVVECFRHARWLGGTVMLRLFVFFAL